MFNWNTQFFFSLSRSLFFVTDMFVHVCVCACQFVSYAKLWIEQCMCIIMRYVSSKKILILFEKKKKKWLVFVVNPLTGTFSRWHINQAIKQKTIPIICSYIASYSFFFVRFVSHMIHSHSKIINTTKSLSFFVQRRVTIFTTHTKITQY